MNKIFIDFETRSEVDIKTVGAVKYAQHPSTKVLCMAYALNDEPVKVLRREQIARPSAAGFRLPTSPFQLVAHNALFEHAIWEYVLASRMRWPRVIDPKRWACTMSRAAMCGLPMALGKLSTALKLHTPKDLEGRMVMLKLCKPVSRDPVVTYNDDPLLFEKLYSYCAQDVEVERMCDKNLPLLPPGERDLWELDLKININGVGVDVASAAKAAAMADGIKEDLNVRLKEITRGKVNKASQVAALKTYIASRGVEVGDSLDKAAVNEILKRPDTPEDVRSALAIRRQVGKASTAKYAAIVNAASDNDSRVRGALQYCGAATGRWAGRLIQPHNFPQGFKEKDQATIIPLIQDGDVDMFTLVYGDKAMESLSFALRGMIQPTDPRTKSLIAVDYNAIEARILFWCADDQSALNDYRIGASPYISMARYIYSNPMISKTTHPREYDIGKRTILGAGYGMGWKRFLATCQQYGVDITEDLAKRAIKSYRDKYKSVVNMWYATEAVAVKAVLCPGIVVPAMGGKVHYSMSKDGRFLVCRLPSGRFLWYYKPSIATVEGINGEEKQELRYWAAAGNESKTDPKCLEFDEHAGIGMFKTYGGSLVENIIQAIARDIMANGMLNVAAYHGFQLLLTIHDEILAEVLDALIAAGTHTLEKMILLMCALPKWAVGCPIAAEGWVGKRSRK